MLSVIVPSVIVLSVIVPSVIVPSVIVLSVIALSVFVLSVIMLSVIVLSVIVLSFEVSITASKPKILRYDRFYNYMFKNCFYKKFYKLYPNFRSV